MVGHVRYARIRETTGRRGPRRCVMSRASALERMPAGSTAYSRHIFVFGPDGEPVSWSPGGLAAVPAALFGVVQGCLTPLAAEFSEIVMHLDERFRVHIVRNALAGPVSYVMVVDGFGDV